MVPLVKIIGAWRGLQRAVAELGAKIVWLEGYGVEIISWIKREIMVGSY